jgi:eukaryotic-like serine/threonine-protein kinase
MSTKIGHYDIVAELGRGGMGVVYKGYETSLNRYVAIKMLSPSLAHDESIKERFLREARSMASLNDPHIIQVFYIGESDEQPYFAMEFVEGESLSTYLKREGQLQPEQAARVIYQTALGLATAHDKGVVHRDIKPGNLMLNSRGQIKIADFGIALSQTDFSKKLTSTGEFVGTPGYLSPEVCTGQPVDLRSDIFSLGIVFFELLTGRMPFTDESPLGLMLEVVRAEIPDVRELNASVDPEMTRILKLMTAKQPAERYQSCHELANDLLRHPLVSGGGSVAATPQMSTNAQTVIGMKTPAPMVRPATPVPMVRPTPAPSAAVAAQAALSSAGQAMPPPRPSVMESQGRRAGGSNAGLIWAFAAVLVLGLGAGSVWAFRDKLFTSTDGSIATIDSDPTKTATGTASTDNAQGKTAGELAALLQQASTNAQQAGETADKLAQESREASADAVENANALVAQNEGKTGDGEATDGDASHTGIASIGAAGDEDEADVADADADESLGPLRRMAAQRKSELQDARDDARDDRRLASNRPAEERREVTRPAGPPKVAVITIGDPAITGPAKQAVEEALMNQGFLIADTDALPGFGRGDLPAMLAAAQRHNVRAVVAVRAEPLGTTQLNYYGQSDTMYSANLTVRPYDTGNRSPLSAGIRAKVDFTALNAEQNARDAIEPQLSRVIGSMSAYRARGQTR